MYHRLDVRAILERNRNKKWKLSEDYISQQQSNNRLGLRSIDLSDSTTAQLKDIISE